MANKMNRKGKLVLDPDEALRLVEKLRKDIDEFGRLIGAGYVVEGSPSLVPHDEAEVGVAIPQEGWTSYRTKGPAGPKEAGWRFSSDRENEVYPEVEALVDRIYESGKVEHGGFTYTLSKDGKFLQRNRARKSSGFKK